jgi:predicted nucleotidyltransferase
MLKLVSMNDTLRALLNIGFLTGSRAYGTAELFSDWDIVISIERLSQIEPLLEGMERHPSDYSNGFKIRLPAGTVINIIPVHPHAYLPWFLATKAVMATLRDSHITNPIQKYALFELLVGAFKGLCPVASTQAIIEQRYAQIQKDTQDIPVVEKVDSHVMDASMEDWLS